VAARKTHLSGPRRIWMTRLAGLAFALMCIGAMAASLSAGCSGWDPAKPFERNSPEVSEALELIDSGKFESAEEILSRYLGTGMCSDGGIGLPDTVRDKYNGSFDLGLVLFHIAEKYGRRFGEEEEGDAGADDPQVIKRSLEIDCALIIVKAIAADPKVPVELRARARYLAGNLEFLRKHYEEAVKEYDDALTLVPGIAEDASGDGIGRDAAWNRAIALRRIQDQKDAGNDAQDEQEADSPDGDDGSDGNDAGPDSGNQNDDASDGENGREPDADTGDGSPDSGDSGSNDPGNSDGGPQKDDRKDQPEPDEPEPGEPKEPAAPDQKQDGRILDRLEEAPSYQEEEAKKRAAGRRRGRMEDK
jgi:hypothetical protein